MDCRPATRGKALKLALCFAAGGEAMVTGTVKSAVRTGATELADGVAKAVTGLLEAHMNRPGGRGRRHTAPPKAGPTLPFGRRPVGAMAEAARVGQLAVGFHCGGGKMLGS